MEGNPTLAEMQDTIRERLVEILTEAQTMIRGAQKLLGSIPPAYRQNGLSSSVDTMLDRLDKADDLFTGAFKSVQETYGKEMTP